MANFIRFGVARILNNNLINTISTKTPKSLLSYSQKRCINLSSKTLQAGNATTNSTASSAVKTQTHDKANDDDGKSENWISWGAHEEDEWWDRFIVHSTCFVTISICIIGGGTFLAYMPDVKQREWATREAYLQLRYREENGLPLIDPNLIDPSKLTLPTDEELGDTEIII